MVTALNALSHNSHRDDSKTDQERRVRTHEKADQCTDNKVRCDRGTYALLGILSLYVHRCVWMFLSSNRKKQVSVLR